MVLSLLTFGISLEVVKGLRLSLLLHSLVLTTTIQAQLEAQREREADIRADTLSFRSTLDVETKDVAGRSRLLTCTPRLLTCAFATAQSVTTSI
jgi:hypothetical protein